MNSFWDLKEIKANGDRGSNEFNGSKILTRIQPKLKTFLINERN